MRTLVLLAFAAGGLLAASRTTISLDGVWNIADSVESDKLPQWFTHTVPVPGLAHSAQPPFAGVDRFDSREFIANEVRRKRMPETENTTAVGRSRQERNYFWYARRFRTGTRTTQPKIAILKINKAQFGVAVWLNGKKIGEHTGCFTAAYFDLSKAIGYAGDNRLVVRVGAHPAVLPASVNTGTDQEKIRWTPGIYDSVSLQLSDNPAIEQVQVAPRLKDSEILVETVVRNHGAQPVSFILGQRVKEWKSGAAAGVGARENVTLKPGQSRTVRQRVAIPKARWWSPESPFLYVLESSSGGDSAVTRFGMREFRFDTATKRAMLNGKPYFMRGSNITLHRFFEDPKSGTLPWDEAWVRKLLAEIPKKLNWNSFRFCIGPTPDKWFEIADEAGLLIQNEYFIWTGPTNWHQEYDTAQLTVDYKEWMRDHWNHPSAAIWDACNESVAPVLSDVIAAVRGLDLSNRPWENGYNLPQGPDDPMEEHIYLESGLQQPATPSRPHFRMTDLERTQYPGRSSHAGSTGHALILNEYGWLWLNRDGTPTVLTDEVYKNLLGPKSTTEQRFALDAYLLGGQTEYFRAHRHFAGILHFVYLMSSYPGVYTSDHFRDVEKLELEPHFVDYISEAFKPLGVYLDFWQPRLQAGKRQFTVMLVNDEQEARAGQLVLTLERANGLAAARAEIPYQVLGLGQQSYRLELDVPALTEDCLLKAVAEGGASPTVSRRKVKVAP